MYIKKIIEQLKRLRVFLKSYRVRKIFYDIEDYVKEKAIKIGGFSKRVAISILVIVGSFLIVELTNKFVEWCFDTKLIEKAIERREKERLAALEKSQNIKYKKK